MTIHPQGGEGGGRYTIRVRYRVSWKGTLLGIYDGEHAMRDAVAKYVRNAGSKIESEVYKISGPFDAEEVVYRRLVQMESPVLDSES